MAAILKLDQLQSDSGTVTVASNLAFSGASTFVGNIANPTITGTLNLTGGGIKFPSTQVGSADANTLDDYEEGEHIATVSPSTSGSITLAGNNTYLYTKVGRIVTVSGRLDVLSVSSPTGELRISLPFTVANLGQKASSSSSVFIWYAGGAATVTGNWIAWLEPNAAWIYFRYGSTSTPSGDAAQYAQSGTEFRFNVTYVAA